MEKTYKDLVSALYKARNELDTKIFKDRQETGKVEFWEAHELCKGLSYMMSQVYDELKKAGVLSD